MQGYNSSAKNVLQLKQLSARVHTTRNSNPEGAVAGFVGILLHSTNHSMIKDLLGTPLLALPALPVLQTTIPPPR